jgi:hypothetical protein
MLLPLKINRKGRKGRREKRDHVNHANLRPIFVHLMVRPARVVSSVINAEK